MLAIVVLALGLMVWAASVASGAQSLTVNGQDVNSITLKVGQSCTVEVVSDDSNPYNAYVGFDDGVALGDFSHLETKPEAGNLASATVYNVPEFSGYFIVAAGSAPAPSAGVHFVFQYVAQEVGETDLQLYDDIFSLVDSVHITVVHAEMGTSFTYQGSLNDAGNPADGLYDFEFELYDAPSDGNQLGNTIDINDLDIIDGQFIVELDFGSDVFAGDARWLETTVAQSDGSDPATLTPRVELTPTPYALYAETAGGDNDWMVSGSDMYAIPSGTVSVSQSHDAAGPGLKVSRSFAPPMLGNARTEIDATSINAYFTSMGTSGTALKLNDESAGNVVLAEGGGNVGIGTTNPLSKLSVGGDGIANIGVYGSGTTGVYGSGSTYGVVGIDSDTGSYGRLGDGDYGVYGSGQIGVRGEGSGISGWGVRGEGSVCGVDGTDSDSGSYGRLGYFTYGVYGNSSDFWGYFIGKGYFSGNVGIGTTSPGAKLDVEGDGTNTPLELDGKGMPDHARAIRVTNTGMADGTNMNFNIGKTDVFGQTGEITYYHAGDADPDNMLSLGLWGPGKILNMTYAGNVGIGTTNPVSKLEVNGRLELPGNDATGTPGTGAIEIGNSLRLDENEIITNTDETLYIQRDNNGKVGIGTLGPANGKLEVNGEISTGHGGLRWKLFSGTTGAINIRFSHGLDASKIFSISCVLRDGDSKLHTGIAQEYQEGSDLFSSFRVTFDDNEVWIKVTGNYYDDAGDTYRCIVWYIDS